MSKQNRDRLDHSHLYKTGDIHNPWLVQRCMIDTHEERPHLDFDYMGSAEFEWGAPQVAMWALFDDGKVYHTVTVEVDGHEVKLYVFVRTGFDIEAYQPYLQALANGKCDLHDSCYLDDKIQNLLGKTNRKWANRINVWFDINNATFITLSDEDAGQLETALNDIKFEWTME